MTEPIEDTFPGHDWPVSAIIQQAGEGWLAERAASTEMARSSALFDQLEDATAALFASAMCDLGWTYAPGDRFSTGDAAERLGVVRAQARLFERILDVLAEDGALRRDGDTWQVLQLLRSIDPMLPEDAIEARLLRLAASHLAPVLRGVEDGERVLFPVEGMSAAEWYRDAPAAVVMNELLGEVVARCLAALPAGRRLRILEAGAGTAATTAHILPHLPLARTEYVVTDISASFLAQAERTLAGYPFVRYERLDMQEEVASDDPDRGRYDIVIAANVVHVTTHVRRSLRHLRERLAPGGLLMLLEATTPLRFVDAIFGLTPGWWAFQDEERAKHPLLTADGWKALLLDSGFSSADSLSAARGSLATQSVIVAAAPVRALQVPHS